MGVINVSYKYTYIYKYTYVYCIKGTVDMNDKKERKLFLDCVLPAEFVFWAIKLLSNL